ncbi:MAG: LLM class flavin-dependent oxidoreductase [Candidatus Latescibacteria bacterium]|nr:LLM class flavin-dependent oxidoreductase [Candidatus Latescibacterota bacterium]
MRRIARIASGWFPQFRPDERGQEIITRFQGYVAEAGRQPADVGIEARISVSSGGPEDWARDYGAWRGLGRGAVQRSGRWGDSF